MPVKVLLVDDHEVVRSGIRSLLEVHPSIGAIAEASNGHEAVMMARKFNPDVVVMDYEMPRFSGVYATREITRERAATKVLLLSMHHSHDMILEGVEAGAQGYLSKDCKATEIIEAIEALSRGGTWFRGAVAETIAPSLIESVRKGKISRKKETLTPREREIVRLIALGKTTLCIAQLLCISKHTVEIHKTNVNKKLNTRNISDITRYAIREEIIRL